MNTLESPFENLASLFRYFLPGGVFLLALWLFRFEPMTRHLSSDNTTSQIMSFTALAVIAFIIGSLIFCIHQFFLHNFILSVIILILKPKKFQALLRVKDPRVKQLWGWARSDYERRFYEWMWSRRNKKQAHQKNIDNWSSLLHFLYCSSYSIMSSVFCCIAFDNMCLKQAVPWLLFGLFLFFPVATWSDMANARLLFDEYENDPKFPFKLL